MPLKQLLAFMCTLQSASFIGGMELIEKTRNVRIGDEVSTYSISEHALKRSVIFKDMIDLDGSNSSEIFVDPNNVPSNVWIDVIKPALTSGEGYKIPDEYRCTDCLTMIIRAADFLDIPYLRESACKNLVTHLIEDSPQPEMVKNIKHIDLISTDQISTQLLEYYTKKKIVWCDYNLPKPTTNWFTSFFVSGEAVFSVICSPDGKHVFFGTDFGNIYLKDDYNELEKFATEPRKAILALVMPDNDHLISGSTSGILHLWNRKKRFEAVAVVDTKGDNIMALAMCPRGKTLLAASSRSVSAWSVDTKNKSLKFGCDIMFNLAPVVYISFLDEHNAILSSTSTPILNLRPTLVSIRANQVSSCIPIDEIICTIVGFKTSNVHSFVTGSLDGTIRLWDKNTLINYSIIKTGEATRICSLALSQDEQILFYGANRTLYMYSVKEISNDRIQLELTQKFEEPTGDIITRVMFKPHSDELVLASRSGVGSALRKLPSFTPKQLLFLYNSYHKATIDTQKKVYNTFDKKQLAVLNAVVELAASKPNTRLKHTLKTI